MTARIATTYTNPHGVRFVLVELCKVDSALGAEIVANIIREGADDDVTGIPINDFLANFTAVKEVSDGQ